MARAVTWIVTLLLSASALAGQATVADAREKGLFQYLAFCFGGGLLALLTPCVFPMVPVTVSYFSKRPEGNALGGALSYSIGIISTFAVFGVVTALVFGATGISAFATNGWVNLAIGLLFVALALNLFGVFELKLPAALARKSDQQRTKGGWVGPFFMGVTFSLTSFTCTAPVAGSLLAAAASGDVLFPIMGMFAFGLAFAAPFFFLALFPSSLAKLPRSGEWMNTIKPALAFIELAAAVKFFSNADLSFQLGIITRPVFLFAWAVIFVAMGLYLLGVPKLIRNVGVGRRVGAVMALAVSALLVMGAKGWPLGDFDAFPPPHPYPSKSHSVASTPSENGSGKAIQASTYEEALAKAKESNRPVFIDFTGVNCVNCRLMEKKVFPAPDVQNEFSRMVTVQLYTDRPTPEDQANQKLQQKLANSVALPTYVVLKPDGTFIAKYEGLAPSIQEFVDFLKQGS